MFAAVADDWSWGGRVREVGPANPLRDYFFGTTIVFTVADTSSTMSTTTM